MVFSQRAENEKRVLGLDAELFNFKFVLRGDAAAREKRDDVAGSGIERGEKRIRKFLLEVAVEIEIGAARIDEHAAGIVVDEKRQEHAFGGDLNPLLVFTALLQFVDVSAVVVAGARGNGRDQSVRADGLSADFDHAHGGAADFGERRVENETAALKKFESVDEEDDAGDEADYAPEEQGHGAVLAVKKE